MLTVLVLAAMLNGSLLGQNVFIRRPAAGGPTERVLVLPGLGIHTESDQSRVYVIPGGGIYIETL